MDSALLFLVDLSKVKIGHRAITLWLSVESSKLLIEDLGSANGTFIGSQRLPANTPSLVPENLAFLLGDVELLYTPAPVVEATQAFVKPKIETVAPAAAPDGPPVGISLVGLGSLGRHPAP